MAKETHREDVRLLSFDLQTVEFVYALVRISDYLYFSISSSVCVGLYSIHILRRSTRPDWWQL